MVARRKKNTAFQTLPVREGTMCPFTYKAKFLSSLSNEVRLTILTIISQKETSVGDFAARLNRSQSALSQRLARLRVAGLVDTRRDGQTIFYSCNNRGAHKILRDLKEIFAIELGEKNLG